MQMPKIIRERSAGIDHPTRWEQTGPCHWEKIAGFHCLVDEAGKIHQVHGDYTPANTLLQHETMGDNY